MPRRAPGTLPPPGLTDISQRLRELIEQSGLSRRAIGAACDPPIDQREIGRILAAASNPTVATVSRILTALGLDWDALARSKKKSEKNPKRGIDPS